MGPTVSVVIPLFNKERWIERTLSSLLSQTFLDWEAIIVDDGSTDGSVQIVEAFIRRNPRNWLLIKNQNAGQCRTRNSGIDRAQGEFIAFLDADDVWSKNKLADQVIQFRDNKSASLVISPYIIFSDNDKSKNYRLVLHKNPRNLLIRWLTFRGYGAGTESTGMTRTSLLREIGGFDETLSTSAGLYLTIELAKRGQIIFSNKSLMAYRIHTGQWHANTEILTRDTAALRERSIEIKDFSPKALDLWHRAYIDMAETRQTGKLYKSLISGGIFSKIFLIRLVLGINIVSRNLISRVKAKFVRKICGFSQVDFQEFTSSF